MRASHLLASGNLLTEWCSQKGKTWFIPGKSPIRVDDIYRPLVIDDSSGLQWQRARRWQRTGHDVAAAWQPLYAAPEATG